MRQLIHFAATWALVSVKSQTTPFDRKRRYSDHSRRLITFGRICPNNISAEYGASVTIAFIVMGGLQKFSCSVQLTDEEGGTHEHQVLSRAFYPKNTEVDKCYIKIPGIQCAFTSYDHKRDAYTPIHQGNDPRNVRTGITAYRVEDSPPRDKLEITNWTAHTHDTKLNLRTRMSIKSLSMYGHLPFSSKLHVNVTKLSNLIGCVLTPLRAIPALTEGANSFRQWKADQGGEFLAIW
uniref:Uncharacterized protein n=1 Tax=Timema genevievae TaxID=629358 RepID=A0A7R9PPE8_TIMGE|nr:unnamed protein product [Timema genevievae]